MIDEGQTHREIDRERLAREVAENPVFREAIDGLRDQLRAEWEQSPARDTEGRERLWLAVNLLSKIESHLSTVMQTGKMARLQLSQEQSKSERLKAWLNPRRAA
jgi:hypothetical protein